MNSECNTAYYSDFIALIGFTGSFIPESAFTAVNQALKEGRKDIVLDLSGAKRIELSSIMDFAKIKELVEERFGRFIISNPPAIFHLLNASLGDSYKFNITEGNREAIRNLNASLEMQVSA